MNRQVRFALGLLLMSGMAASAQWVTQEFSLQPGWNSIWLQVQPEPADCATVVANGGVDIDQILTYNDSFSSVQFIQNISEASVEDQNHSWLRWGASANVVSEVPALHAIIAGRAYLVYTTNGGTWKVRGVPLMKPVEWRADRLNLVGFAVDTNHPPYFASFFASCDKVDLSKIYRLDSAGNWTTNTVGLPMVAGEAFWIQTTNGVPEFQGPVSVSTGSRYGLDYGKTVMELPVNVKVEGANDTVVFIQPILSEVNPASEEYPAYAGLAPMMWWNPNAPDSTMGKWERLTDQVSITLPGTNTTTLRFAVLRREFPEFSAPVGMDPIYTGLLHIGDGTSLSVNVPVRAVGTTTPAPLDGIPLDATGLWVGNVTVSKVSQPYPVGNPGTHPVAEGSEYSFRLILHCSSNGVVRLLSHAALIWQDGTYSPPTNGIRTVATAGHYVIVGNDTNIPAMLASSSGHQLDRRISSAAFSHALPLAAVDATSNSVHFVVQTPYNDPRSPFVHPYHPMHDNKTAEGGSYTNFTVITNSIAITNFLGEGWSNEHVNTNTPESFSVTRCIDLTFGLADPDSSAEWGTGRLGGEWREVITGLHSVPLEVRGEFVIQQVNSDELEY